MLDLYTGGAHCCSVEQVFTFDPGTMTYAETERNFGDPGTRIEDLKHDGHFEFVTADDALRLCVHRLRRVRASRSRS